MAKVPFLKTEIMDCAAVLITIPLGGTHGNIPYKYTTVQVYDYKKKPPWETMCCELWPPAFGSPALVPSFGPLLWARVLGRQGPWPIGPVRVASPLGHYVLHQSLETMCCIALRKLCVVSPLGEYVLQHPWQTMYCIAPGKVWLASPLGDYVYIKQTMVVFFLVCAKIIAKVYAIAVFVCDAIVVSYM